MSATPLDNFIRESDALIKFATAFVEMRDDTHSVFTLEIRGREITSIWADIKPVYKECLKYLESSDLVDTTDVEAAESKYEATFNAYVNCLGTINEKLSNLQQKATMKPSSPDVNTAHSIDNTGHNMLLPPCDIDDFEGDFVSWPTFRDLFIAIYIKNLRLSNIERLCHLLKKTKCEAREIVSKCPHTNEGFDIAWKNLSDTYDNPRLLVNDQLKRLFGLPYLDKESSSELKLLQRGINGCLSAMSTYDIPTQNWDPILVFICIQRLPSLTVNLWEQSIKNKSAMSLWKELDKFLAERAMTLECVRDLRGPDNSTRPSGHKVKSHHTNASSSTNASENNSSASNRFCPLCKKQTHMLRSCLRFKQLSVSERFALVKKNNCCINCLSKVHMIRNCGSQHNCTICNKRHHTMLHREEPSTEPSEINAGASTSVSRTNNSIPVNSSLPNGYDNSINFGPSTSVSRTSNSIPVNSSLQSGSNANNSATGNITHGNNSATPFNRQVFHSAEHRSVLLGTAMVNLLHMGITYPVRALIDPGSEATFISERLQNRLKLPTNSTNARISGINQAVSATTRKICSIHIGSPLDSSRTLQTMALVIRDISGNLPSFTIPSYIKDYLPNIQLADVNFFDCRPVDILIGADLYPDILLGEIRRNILGSLLAQSTIFGWVITGPIEQSSIQVYSTKVDFSEEDTLNQNLLKFWELEETPKRKILSPFDKYCEENYKATTCRGFDGRYVVALPFKLEFPETLSLGTSRPSVMGQYLRNESSLERKPEIKETYDDVVREYLDLDHMRPVSSTTLHSCYLPHHPVMKPDSKTTKLRVVFNASHKTSNGISLNDCLYVGPTLQADLVLLILRWRLFRFVFNCDITQMYRQIRVDPTHTSFQRILFRNHRTEEVRDYELQTVTFGVNCAPYLAIRTLLQLADDTEKQYPLAAHILRDCMYVDDVLTGTHDISTAVIARDQLIAALSSAKFELRKWTSNEQTILDSIPLDHLVDAKLLEFVESSGSKTLGIQWNAQLDSFYFRVNPIPHKSGYTKREVLSTIAKLFDPVGWLSPVIIVAKIIMQRIWLDNINWDDKLPLATENEWKKFVSTYLEVNKIRIPRWVHYTPNSFVELHVFSDASEKAYAGVIYIRVRNSSGEIYSNMLTSKTKVAPIKSISLPRLELCGAVLASELLKTVLREIYIQIDHVYCWTDSTIVLSWLRKTPSTWTTFVANRVCRIQENVGNHNWYHVRSEDNPADLGSRGISPSELATNSLWWYGPEWLRREKNEWKISNLSSLDTDIECRVKTHASFFKDVTGNDIYEDILANYSHLDKALRIISYILRFFYNSHPSHKSGRNLYENFIK
ncbi:uncharacterized protein LOC135958718 [Calliphora vicina]|uniref:uncharacterized protein LOC135958718 n=1 Tax=Calliphora vicina TaxID=7373 RepID=UPI00325B7BD8